MAKSSGGIGGTGIFGLFGSVVTCKSTDDSLYCSIMKLFNLLMVFLIVGFVLYYVYALVSYKRGMRGGYKFL